MSDVINCQSIMTCSSCVREDCWWLVLEDYSEECSPVLAGVPNVREWFHGPGSCRQFNCVRDVWDIYGLLQVLGGGAGGALLGGGLVWNLFRGGYERLRNVNRPTSRCRRIMEWIVRAFRVMQEERQGEQNERGPGAEAAAGQADERNGRVFNLAPLDQVVVNNAGGAVNIDVGQLLRDQEDELREVEDLLRQRNLELQQVQQELLGRQQQHGNGEPAVQNDVAEDEQDDHEDGGQVNPLPAGNETRTSAAPRNNRAGPSGSKIPLPLARKREESLSSSSSDSSSTGPANTDLSSVIRRSTPHPTASSQQLASARLSMGLPSTPVSSGQAPARSQRSAAQVSSQKTLELRKNKQI